jgi:crotonobetainyl-CoA:carnitine CoA-transferase CaiB-like acyl-CoA transferase
MIEHNSPSTLNSLLNEFTVVDITGELGLLTSRFLTAFGAKVTRVGLSELRDLDLRKKPPFAMGSNRELVSIPWIQAQTDCAECSFDLDSLSGQQDFRSLVLSADVVVESLPIGWLDQRDLGYSAFRDTHPALVWTSITPFGLSGPRAEWAATDLIGMAAGGLLSLCGDSDRPPLRCSVEQGYAQAGAVGLVGTVAAVLHRMQTGRGQLVDVSMQEAISNCLGNARLYYEFDELVSRRAGGGRAYGDSGSRLVYRCSDGHVAVSRTPGTIGPLHSWMIETGYKPAFDPDEWAALPQAGPGAPSGEKTKELESDLAAFFATRNKDDLFNEGQRRGLLICPVSTPLDLLSNPQLRARHFFNDRFVEEFGRTVSVQGAPVLTSEPMHPRPRTASNARDESTQLSVTPTSSDDSRSILAGVRVADFSWVGVGPLATQMLATLGAEVIRVESPSRLDSLRSAGPKRGPDEANASAYFANFNRDKRGMTLNLSHPRGREVALRLARVSDVWIESFRPGVMDAFGLSAEEVRRVNPSIIVMSCSMEGSTGPQREYKGYGLTLQSLAGFTHFTGWPDRDPVGMGTAYTDWFASSIAAATLLAAIANKKSTGIGRSLDLSQLETCIWALDAELLYAAITGELRSAIGNRHETLAPHGVFPCFGDDEWVAIAVRDQEDWASLVDVVGEPLAPWEAADEFIRRREQDAIEHVIASWTAELNKHSAAEMLQKGGVPAYPVADMNDVQHDPQLRARGHYWRIAHPTIGEADWDAPAFRLSATPLYPNSPAPLLGQHNEMVYRQVLGYTESELVDLVTDGVLE